MKIVGNSHYRKIQSILLTELFFQTTLNYFDILPLYWVKSAEAAPGRQYLLLKKSEL